MNCSVCKEALPDGLEGGFTCPDQNNEPICIECIDNLMQVETFLYGLNFAPPDSDDYLDNYA